MKMPRKGVFFLLPLLFCAAVFVYGRAHGYAVNVTASLERGLYRASGRPPTRGDVVGFCLGGTAAELAGERGYLSSGSCATGLRPLMKYLAGMPGDIVMVTPDGVHSGPPDGPQCLWPVHALAEDSHGRPLSAARLNGIIPAGCALVLTLHTGGYDSRYFGLVPLAALVTYNPVFTF